MYREENIITLSDKYPKSISHAQASVLLPKQPPDFSLFHDEGWHNVHGVETVKMSKEAVQLVRELGPSSGAAELL